MKDGEPVFPDYALYDCPVCGDGWPFHDIYLHNKPEPLFLEDDESYPSGCTIETEQLTK